MLALFVVVTAVLAVLDLRAPAKKPLVFTRRVRRLYGFIVLLCLAGSALLSLISLPPYLLYAGNCYIVMGAAALAQPLENRINGQFFERARKKLESRPDLIKIGITGSYGKTSTKFVLRDILSQKYRVLATPASFNTPMGLSRVINEQLKGEHQIFIAEMGARHVGDIKELCELVHPKYGLLTSVGPQHLETFGSIENIAGTKYELIEALPKDGIAFFSSDGSYVDRLFAKCEREKYRVGFNPDRQPYMLATDIEVSPQGSRFTLKCADGESLRCRTRLLGQAQHPEHRPVRGRGPQTGPDHGGDCPRRAHHRAHRASPAADSRGHDRHRRRLQLQPRRFAGGAQRAFRLPRAPHHRHARHGGAGREGRRTQLRLRHADGQLRGRGHTRRPQAHQAHSVRAWSIPASARDDIHVVSELDEASALLRVIGKPGDTVLFENDLPDNYTE